MKNRLPPWFRQEIPGPQAKELLRLFAESGVHTVCLHAHCPNISDCFKNKRATFMILGSACTRNCGFCAVAKAGQKKLTVDEGEPDRVAGVVKRLGLAYAVITSVSRDDLVDKGAGLFAKTIEAVRRVNNSIKIEVLIPDFQGDAASLKQVLDAAPNVLAHNIETVPRLYRNLRPQADYQRSLGILKASKKIRLEIPTKSSIMLGLGEARDEVVGLMRRLRRVNCDYLALGQYLAPSEDHYPVKRFLGLAEFREYRRIGLGLGFKAVLSGPKVRSSYQA
ncbi:MAG: lipoyl synthase [Candidatus Omnitrophota bacterium]